MKKFRAIQPDAYGIGELAMAEDVHEQAAVRLEQRRHLRHQRLVVAHVLEHLDRHDAVEAALELERVHVGRHDRDVRGRPRLDPLALRVRVRDRGDSRIGKRSAA